MRLNTEACATKFTSPFVARKIEEAKQQ
jgi:hypothetical protein